MSAASPFDPPTDPSAVRAAAQRSSGTQDGTHDGAPGGTPDGTPDPAVPLSPRDANPQYVLPLVVRIERDAPPQRTDALETAARAVLTFLSDPRATEPDAPWTALVHAWTDGRIRKVVRRARGAEWRRAEALDGLTVVSGAEPVEAAAADGAVLRTSPAEVRVFPPVPLDGWPKDLARLQVSGTDLTDLTPPAPPAPGLPVLWLNPDLDMTAGKAMAQAGHAAQIAWWELTDAQRKEWADAGFALAVRTAAPDAWPALAGSGLPTVRDAGFTEIAPGSCTVVAEHPALLG